MRYIRYFMSFKTLLIKEIRRFASIWPQTILPPIITTALYFLIFGEVMGARIGEMSGFSYIQFIAPGLIMMTVITNAYGNVSTSFFMAKFSHSIEELLVAPIPTSFLLLGYVGGGIIRGMVVALVVTLTAIFFTGLPISHFGLMLFAVVFCSALFSLGGLINAIFAKKFDGIAIVPTFVLTPLTYLGGVFFSIHLLPEPWKSMALFNPILYFINLFRYGMLGISDVSIIHGTLILLTIFFFLYVIAWWLLDRGVGTRS